VINVSPASRKFNACIPDGVPRAAPVPITFRWGAFASAAATIDLR
jgi:hypothetical protein